jgi:hypothetical protein
MIQLKSKYYLIYLVIIGMIFSIIPTVNASTTTQWLEFSTESTSPIQLVVDVTYKTENGYMEWTMEDVNKSYYYSIGLSDEKIYYFYMGEGFETDTYSIMLKQGENQILSQGQREFSNEYKTIWVFTPSTTGIYTLIITPRENMVGMKSFCGLGFFELTVDTLESSANGNVVQSKANITTNPATVALFKTNTTFKDYNLTAVMNNVRYFHIGESLALSNPLLLTSQVGNVFPTDGLKMANPDSYILLWNDSPTISKLYQVQPVIPRKNAIEGFQPIFLIGLGIAMALFLRKKIFGKIMQT